MPLFTYSTACAARSMAGHYELTGQKGRKKKDMQAGKQQGLWLRNSGGLWTDLVGSQFLELILSQDLGSCETTEAHSTLLVGRPAALLQLTNWG